MINIKRIQKFEFWPFWVFYIPAYLNWLRLSIKEGSLIYFTNVNPLMNNSGALNVSKFSYLKKLPTHWVPRLCLIDVFYSKEQIEKKVAEMNLSYPFIAKPDNGERGKGVRLVNSINELFTHIHQHPYKDWLLQVFSDQPNEAGILFYRFPNEKHGYVSSITLKSFCVIKGNGNATFRDLVLRNLRISKRWREIKNKHETIWDNVIPLNGEIQIEPIGSHNLGTTFYDGYHLKSNALNDLINSWVEHLPGFYYGRFDIKYNTWEKLIEGKDFSIIEVNGVNSEPTHIYQPDYSIRKAYQDIFSHMEIIRKISRQNRQLGVQSKPLKYFLKEFFQTVKRHCK